MQNKKDKKLITGCLKGNNASLEILIKKYLQPIYGFIYRYTQNSADAQDITQEVFIRMWRHLKKFDQQRNFKSWLFSIAKNACVDFIRKKKTVPFSRLSAAGFDIEGKLADGATLPSQILERQDLNRNVHAVIKKLSQKYKTVLSLRYNDCLTFREIATILQESINTVKSRHRRALSTLKKSLANLT